MLQFTLKVGSKTLVSCGMNRKFQCKSFREVLIFSNKEKPEFVYSSGSSV